MDKSLRYFAVAGACLVIAGLTAWGCGGGSGPDDDTPGVWPPFTATYEMHDGDSQSTYTITYKSAREWTSVELDADYPDDPSTATFDGLKLTLTDSSGDVTELPLEPGHTTILPFSRPWGSPVASRSELLKMGWKPDGPDGQITKTTTYHLDCTDNPTFECAGPEAAVDVVETYVRDRHGIPVSYSETARGKVLYEAHATELKVEADR